MTTELREDRSRRSASKIERWCPTAREQAALPPGCSHCKTLQVAACGTTLQDKSDKRFAGVIATLPRSVAPRGQFAQGCGIPMDAATSSSAHGAHRATPVSRRCVLATSSTTASTWNGASVLEIAGSTPAGRACFFRGHLHRMWALRRTRILPVCRTTKRPWRSRRCLVDRKCVGSV